MIIYSHTDSIWSCSFYPIYVFRDSIQSCLFNLTRIKFGPARQMLSILFKIQFKCVLYSHTDSIWHVFEFNGVEVCPTLEEFSAIMEEPSVNDLVFPTMCGDLPTLIQALLGVPLENPKQWCIFSKMNVRLIFAYFSRLSRYHVPDFSMPFAYTCL